VQLSVSAGTETYFKIYDGFDSVLGTITAEGTDLYKLVRSDNVYRINGLVSGDELNQYIISCDAYFNSRHVQGANSVTLSHIQLASRDGEIIYNYIFDSEYSVKLSGYIEPLPLEVSWDTAELVYNGNSQCPEYISTTGIPAVDSSNLIWSVSGKNMNVGVYSASVHLISSDASTDIRDFRLQNSTCAYKIISRPITLKPHDNSVVYDGNTYTLRPFYVSEGTLVAGDNFTATYSGTGRNAGTYYIKPVNIHIFNSSGVDITDNYDITAAAGELVIQPRPVTVSGITADDKDYDGTTDAALDVSSAQISNVVDGDTLSLDDTKLSGVFDDPAIGTDKHVTITYSDGALTGGSSGNYTLDAANSQTDAYADIGGREVTVTVKDIAVTYGESASFEIELSGFLTPEELAALDISGVTYKVGTSEQNAVPYTTTLPAGTYNIYADVSSFSAENYYFTPVSGTLTVSPRQIAVVAAAGADIGKEYDGGVSASVSASDYQFTAVSGVSASGIVNGDTVNLIFTAAYNNKDVLTANAVDMTALSVDNNNYQLVTDTFAITGHIDPKALTVKAKDMTVTYGADSAPAYEAEYSGFAGDEDESVLSGVLSFSCDYDPDVSGRREVRTAGYTITPAGVSSGNYTISFSNGTLTVVQAEAILLSAL
ncbi:MAG: YDG domain-containing protein, partial [Oscillospiraceae bacterium]